MTPKPPHGFRRGGGASQPFAHPKIWGKTKITARRGAKSLHPNPGGLAHPRSPACGGGAQIWGGWGGGYDPQPRVLGRFCPQNDTGDTHGRSGGASSSSLTILARKTLRRRPPPTSSAPSRASVSPPGGCFRRRSPQERFFFWGGQQNQLTRSPGAPGSPFSPAFPGSP